MFQVATLYSVRYTNIEEECEDMQPSEPIIIELDIKRLAKENLIATVGLSILFLTIHFIMHPTVNFQISILSALFNFFLFIILYIILIILHEAFHLIGFMIFGGVPFRDLKYGLNLELGVAYATTEQPVSNRAMKHALLLPFWTTGVIPAIIGLYLDSTLWLLLAAFLIAGAVGDFSMYKKLKKFPPDALVKDDPKLPRLYVYTKKVCKTG